jgi:hypothetical protein
MFAIVVPVVTAMIRSCARDRVLVVMELPWIVQPHAHRPQ